MKEMPPTLFSNWQVQPTRAEVPCDFGLKRCQEFAKSVTRVVQLFHPPAIGIPRRKETNGRRKIPVPRRPPQ